MQLRSMKKLALCVAAVMAVSGCFTTRVHAGPSAGPMHSDRQWFLLAGLIPLSPPAGRECLSGVAVAESKVALMDMLIPIGLGIIGGAAGALACGGSTENAAACAGAGAWLAGLLQTRTVWYSCSYGRVGEAGEAGDPFAIAPVR